MKISLKRALKEARNQSGIDTRNALLLAQEIDSLRAELKQVMTERDIALYQRATYQRRQQGEQKVVNRLRKELKIVSAQAT